jgi:hypothetical protein
MEKQKPKDIYIVVGNVHPDTGELKREDEDGVTGRGNSIKKGVLDKDGYKRIL